MSFLLERATAWRLSRLLGALDQMDAQELALGGWGSPLPIERMTDTWLAEAEAGGLAMTASDQKTGEVFAMFGMTRPFAGGVVQGGFLARDHAEWRRPIARLASILRDEIPLHARERGVQRIEARSWADHPTAPQLLRHLRFEHEAELPAYGIGGVAFRQWRLITPKEDPDHG